MPTIGETQLVRSALLTLVLTAVLPPTFTWAQDARPPNYLGPVQPTPPSGGPSSPAGPTGPSKQAEILPNVRVSDTVGDDPTRPQAETSVAIDPTNPRRLVGGFNDCRGFIASSRNGVNGWGYSVDGGRTWTGVETGLPKAAPVHFGTRSDPSLDVDAQGNFYYAALYAEDPSGRPPFTISVHKGRFQIDGRFVWEAPALIAPAGQSLDADKEHIGVDKSTGYVYVAYANFAQEAGPIEIVRSTDGGKTWSQPVAIVPRSDPDFHQGPIPRVGPNGEVYVAWESGWPNPSRAICLRKSVQWPSFGPTITVSSVTASSAPLFTPGGRMQEFPTMAIDTTTGPNRGRVYIAWNDGRFGTPLDGRCSPIGPFPPSRCGTATILLTHSADGSAGSWSGLVRLDDDRDLPSVSRTDRWFAWLAIDSKGVVHASWYDRRLRGADPSLTDVFGTTFTPSAGVATNTRLTNQTFSMNVLAACMPAFGDYNGAATSPIGFHTLWADGREGGAHAYAGGATTGPIVTRPSTVEACQSGPTKTTIAAIGGPGLFGDDVTLTLLDISPPTSTITARFDPDPIPRPSELGGISGMRILTTENTPPGAYTLTIQASDGVIKETAELILIVRAELPAAPTLSDPPDGAQGVLETPTFSWKEAPQAADYQLEIFRGDTCDGEAVRIFEGISASSFTVPRSSALDFQQAYSWRVIARNACGQTVSAKCFRFSTRFCGPAEDFAVNGGFEEDLEGWVVDAAVPEPVVTKERPHSGKKAVKLGYIDQGASRTGNAEIHQSFHVPENARDPRLSFWFWPQGNGSLSFFRQSVFLRQLDPPQTILLESDVFNDQEYLYREVDLESYKGRTIELHFRVQNTSFSIGHAGVFVDDVSLTYQPCEP